MPTADIPFYLIGLNTNLYYKSNHETEGLEDPFGQFAWLESLLTEIRAEGKKVIFSKIRPLKPVAALAISDNRTFFLSLQALIFAHVPPGKFERFYQYYVEIEEHGYPWFSHDFNEKYLNVLSEFSDIVPVQIYGHHHTDLWKVCFE